MNLKKTIRSLALAALAWAGVAGCSRWTEVEPRKVAGYDNTHPARPESYYEALRAWKRSDHPVSFGWYDGWGQPAAATTGMLMGVPDSMDIVSLWSHSANLSPGQREDLRFVQQNKGTKVLICTFIQWIGKGFTPSGYDTDEATREAFWGWRDGDEQAIRASMEKYAGAIADTIRKYGYDGLDIDFEPNVDGVAGKLDENSTYVTWFLDILCKHLGPQSRSGRMLVIDGELTEVPASAGACFDYFVSQAYSVSGGTPSPTAGGSESNLDWRLRRVVDHFSGVLSEEEVTNRFIVTENLESAIDALNGGFFWRLRDGTRLDKKECPSLLGMARWQPVNGFRKGGFGAYKFSSEAVNKPAYKWMHAGIRAQNPVVK